MPRFPRIHRAFKPCALVFMLLFVAAWGRVLWWQLNVPARPQVDLAAHIAQSKLDQRATVQETLDLGENLLKIAESTRSEKSANRAFNIAMDAYNTLAADSGQRGRAMALRTRAGQMEQDIHRATQRRNETERLLLHVMLSITGLLLVTSAGWLCWRRFHKPPPGHCRQCGYNLRGLTEPRCPECATEFDPSTVPEK